MFMESAEFDPEICRKCLGCQELFPKNYPICAYCNRPSKFTLLGPLIIAVIKTQSDYDQALDFIRGHETLGLDTEGNSLSPFSNDLLLIQIGTAEKVFIFDFRWHKKLAVESFWSDKLFVVHNVKYDYKVLKHTLGVVLQKVFDTYLAERILTCGLSHRNGLKDVAEKHLGLEMDKEIRDEFISMTYENFDSKVDSELLNYSAKDVQVLLPIAERQKWELIALGLMDVANLEFDVSKVISEIELNGIHLDTGGWKKIIARNQIKKQEIEQKIRQFLEEHGFAKNLLDSDSINLNSTKDLMTIFKRLGVPIKSTMDYDLKVANHPFADLLREYREFEKQLTAFGGSVLELVRQETSRIHPSFQQIGADTGRTSCSEPNLQQIPTDRAYRECFTAPEGRKIISVDYSQQELRILASLSGDPKFIKFYEDGVDLHTATASMMFNLPLEKIQKDTHRKIAKTINFGLAYGQGAKALGITIGVDEKTAAEMIDKYFSQFTFIRDWLNNAAKEAKEKGFSQTLAGRKRFYVFPKKFDPDFQQKMSSIGRRGKNTPIQGSGADMIKLAMTFIQKRLMERNLDAFLINIVHDELMLEASEQDAEETVELVKNSMMEASRILAPNVPALAEGEASDHWEH